MSDKQLLDKKFEVISPKMAEELLNRNTCNRKLREGVVEKYAADMKKGKWTPCPVPISFYDNNEIADGQHRLYAIIESNTSQLAILVHGLPRECALNLDTGASRTFKDNAQIMSGVSLSTNLIATCRFIHWGASQTDRPPSNAEVAAVVNQHHAAADFAVRNVRKENGLRRGCIYAAVGRAWYHIEDKAKLERFCEVFSSGFSNGDNESAAIAARNFCIAASQRGQRSRAADHDIFLRVQNSIRQFMLGRTLTICRPVSEEAYPLKEVVQKLKRQLRSVPSPRHSGVVI